MTMTARGTPELLNWELPGNPPMKIQARLLARVSSRREGHNHTEAVPERGWKCSACRWIEIEIFRTHDNTYVVYTLGRSALPDESDRPTVTSTTSPFEVIELLTVRRRIGTPGNTRMSAFVPTQSARALAQAAEHDNRLRDAYENRAID